MTALLEVQRACKTFRSGIGARRRRVMALADVSLSVGEGEIVALVGESGSGKSPLGRAVVGLERLDEARLFDSVEYACMSERSIRKLRPQMHLVLQDPYQSLHPGMRIATAGRRAAGDRRQGERQVATRGRGPRGGGDDAGVAVPGPVPAL